MDISMETIIYLARSAAESAIEAATSNIPGKYGELVYDITQKLWETVVDPLLGDIETKLRVFLAREAGVVIESDEFVLNVTGVGE